MLKNLINKLNPTDLIVVSFYSVLTAINIIFQSRIELWWLFLIINTGIIALITSLAYYDNLKNRLLHFCHSWYVAPLILLTFKELYFMIRPIHLGRDYDNLFIEIDRWLFGMDPTVFLYQFANPVLTEMLQIVYSLFYFLPIFLAINMLSQKKKESFHFLIFCIVYGFFLSYIGYLFLPAIGPRFTLHSFENLNIELPGLFVTNFLRDFLNYGESLKPGILNPHLHVQRDVFPSGHTQMTLITMYLTIKMKATNNLKIFLLVCGSLLIFSTVYLRYHYFIDVVGGFIFFIITMVSGFYIYNKWMKRTGNKEYFYPKV